MEEMELFPQERRPRRQHRTKTEIFKEQYLPYLILLLAAIMIIIFILGALGRSAAPEVTALQRYALWI